MKDLETNATVTNEEEITIVHPEEEFSLDLVDVIFVLGVILIFVLIVAVVCR